MRGYIDAENRLEDQLKFVTNHPEPTQVYGVPKGGAILAGRLAANRPDLQLFPLLELQGADPKPGERVLIVDDIRDSGATLDRVLAEARQLGLTPTVAVLYWKCGSNPPFPPENPAPFAYYPSGMGGDSFRAVCGDAPALDAWIPLPWETKPGPDAAEDGFRRMLQGLNLGGELLRPGMAETPARYVKMLRELTAGYAENPLQHAKVFDEPEAGGLVSVRDLKFWSLCEHHLAPFFGTVSVTYRPAQGRVIGLSKVGRIVDTYARRFQVQERLGEQVRTALEEILGTGVRVEVRATHLCMAMRGVQKDGAETHTVHETTGGVE